MCPYSRQPVKGLQFDLLDLAPEGKTISGELPCEEFDLDDLPRRTFTEPIRYHLKLTPINAGHDLLVQGCLDSSLLVVCDRCDEEFPWRLECTDVCHEYENAFGTTVDLTDDLREDLLLAIPQHFLCREDCLGLCPACGQNLNRGACDCPLPDEEENDEPISTNASDPASPWHRLDGLKLS